VTKHYASTAFVVFDLYVDALHSHAGEHTQTDAVSCKHTGTRGAPAEEGLGAITKAEEGCALRAIKEKIAVPTV
jgi:hypothetical protein